MKNVAHLLAEKLLKINALKLQPANPFVWASGWNSPIYTDNRRTLSYPDVRSFIKIELTRMIMENFPDAEAIAGVATGAIAQGALVADLLNLPYVYIRSSPKDHGLENLTRTESSGSRRPRVDRQEFAQGCRGCAQCRQRGCGHGGPVYLWFPRGRD